MKVLVFASIASMPLYASRVSMNKAEIGRYYRPELDVLRFLAFLSVFIVHRMDHLPIEPSQHF